MAWFERRFTFDLPVWMFPNIVERLRGTPARVEDLVRGVPPEILRRRDGERWSIQEQIGHLLDLGELDLLRLDDYAAGRAALSPADLGNRKTFDANHNATPCENILQAFRAERAAFVSRLDACDDEAYIQRAAVHPRLQISMRLLDFAFFIAEHDDHHLAAITELIHKFRE